MTDDRPQDAIPEVPGFRTLTQAQWDEWVERAGGEERAREIVRTLVNGDTVRGAEARAAAWLSRTLRREGGLLEADTPEQ